MMTGTLMLRAARNPQAPPAEAPLTICSQDLLATVEGALIWPQEHLLALADLHLEKGSFFATRRQLAPPYDTAETLRRLSALIARYAPSRLLFLGDSFHDRHAGDRIAAADRDHLDQLLAGREVIWILGNHDPQLPEGLRGDAAHEIAWGPLLFRHEPSRRAEPGEIAGHLHPAARIATRGRAIRRPCFISTPNRAVLPAFGAYTGGLNVRDAAFAPLFADDYTVHVLGDERLFAFPHGHCLPDHRG